MNRIAKVIARSGLCSRRKAEEWIKVGRVKVDGKVIESAALNVSEKNEILLDDKPIPKLEKTRLWIFHKPKGFITSNSDPEGRKTIFDILPDDMPRVVTIGRLDYNSEGLLLLTNDGELSRKIELPQTGWVRTYKARAYGKINQSKLNNLRKGAVIDGVKYSPAKIEIQRQQGDNIWLEISITEGKNREVRKMMQYAGANVNRLIRISFGPYHLNDIKVGDVVEVNADTNV